MRYWGKIIGLVIGTMSGGGIFTILLGVFIGHLTDKALMLPKNHRYSGNQNRQLLFFHTTFQVMGHLSKSKGRVTDADIQMATLQMDRMKLHGPGRAAAQQAFRQGKQRDYPLRQKLRELKSACFGRYDLLRVFLEIQIQAAFVDEYLHPNEQRVLYVIAEEFGFSRRQFDHFLHTATGRQNFNNGRQHKEEGSQQRAYSSASQLQDACSLLGVTNTDDKTTVKRAYRKMMSEYHPDKLVTKGLPPQMMERAKQKAQEIQAAYELIRRQRGF